MSEYCRKCYVTMPGIMASTLRKVCFDCGGASAIQERLEIQKRQALERLKDGCDMPRDYKFFGQGAG